MPAYNRLLSSKDQPQTIETRNSVLDQALALGLPVFPCIDAPGNKSIDKAPSRRGGNCVYDATSDPDKIRYLWEHWPGGLIGVPTGELSGFDVLDVDPRNGGDKWYLEHRDKLEETRKPRCGFFASAPFPIR